MSGIPNNPNNVPGTPINPGQSNSSSSANDSTNAKNNAQAANAANQAAQPDKSARTASPQVSSAVAAYASAQVNKTSTKKAPFDLNATTLHSSTVDGLLEGQPEMLAQSILGDKGFQALQLAGNNADEAAM